MKRFAKETCDCQKIVFVRSRASTLSWERTRSVHTTHMRWSRANMAIQRGFGVQVYSEIPQCPSSSRNNPAFFLRRVSVISSS
ncbi:hypothetical protein chiPu_0001752 [Chiloscyllium punctatum]|uniref:Uncharacterized protein n=1 Tax=Chiloscyllium punctatum TaxID=137246 RepID=A0A401RZ34_CHIPU|nr:hypothetical protein [Chiloscyllium punctatum]